MRRLVAIIFIVSLLPVTVFAANFQAGKQYKIVKSNPAMVVPKGKVEVIEFFSPGCPWCFKLEPELEKWLASKPKNIVFKRVPVAFEAGWEILAKAYYAAEALGVAKKMVPIMFNAIHVKNMPLTNKAQLANLFEKNGVNKQKFLDALEFSPGIEAQLSRGNQLMQQYKVYSIPTIVINGKYKTNSGLTGGNTEEMMKVVNYLIAKVEK